MAKKKKKNNRKTRNINKSPYKNIERMWADKGVINIQKKDGTKSILTVNEAAQRAVQINNMPTFNEEEKKHRLFFVDNIITLCREAKAQTEDKGDKLTQDLQNMLGGKLPDGSPLTDSSYMTPDVQVQQFVFKYTTLTEKEVETVVDNKEYTFEQKDYMLMRLHAMRMEEEAAKPIE